MLDTWTIAETGESMLRVRGQTAEPRDILGTRHPGAREDNRAGCMLGVDAQVRARQTDA